MSVKSQDGSQTPAPIPSGLPTSPPPAGLASQPGREQRTETKWGVTFPGPPCLPLGQSRVRRVPNFLGLLVTSSLQNPDKYFPTHGLSNRWPRRHCSHTATTEWDSIMLVPLTSDQTSHPLRTIALAPQLDCKLLEARDVVSLAVVSSRTCTGRYSVRMVLG